MPRTSRAVLLAALLSLSPSFAAVVPVRILALNDFHGHIEADRTLTVHGRKQPAGGAAWITSYVRRARAEQPNTLLVEAGDMAGGSPPVSALFQDEPTVEFLRTAGCAVGTLGNHELDEGIPEAIRLWKGGKHTSSRYYPKPFPGAGFPIVCSNLVDAKTGKTFFPAYTVRKVAGVKIGFIGAVTEEVPNVVASSALKGVAVLDPVAGINKAASELKKNGVHALVVLFHEGGRQEKNGALTGRITDLVKALDKDVDVVVSAHSHQFTNTFIGRTLVTQAYWGGTAIADISLGVDTATHDIVNKRAGIVDVLHDGLAPAADVDKMVNTYVALAAPRINKVVAVSATPMPKPDRGTECVLGDLIADAQRAAVGADIAFMNVGGIRDGLPAGPVTWGQLYSVQPFGNQVVTLRLTGRQIRALLEQQWGAGEGGEPRRQVLQVSGLSYVYNPAAEDGRHLVSVFGPEGKPLEDGRTYAVAMNSFLAGGGDGFTMLKGISAKPGPSDLDALMAYMAKHPNVVPATGRIRAGSSGSAPANH